MGKIFYGGECRQTFFQDIKTAESGSIYLNPSTKHINPYTGITPDQAADIKNFLCNIFDRFLSKFPFVSQSIGKDEDGLYITKKCSTSLAHLTAGFVRSYDLIVKDKTIPKTVSNWETSDFARALKISITNLPYTRITENDCVGYLAIFCAIVSDGLTSNSPKNTTEWIIPNKTIKIIVPKDINQLMDEEDRAWFKHFGITPAFFTKDLTDESLFKKIQVREIIFSEIDSSDQKFIQKLFTDREYLYTWNNGVMKIVDKTVMVDKYV